MTHDEVEEDPGGNAWEATGLPGAAGSGLVGCLAASLVVVAVTIAALVVLVGGDLGLIGAALVATAWFSLAAISVWQIREMRLAGGYTRIAAPQEVHAASAAAQAVVLGTATIVLEVVKAAHAARFSSGGDAPESLDPALWPTGLEALAFALAVADRYAFEVYGEGGRDAIMAMAVPRSIQLVGGLFDTTEDPEQTLDTLDAIGREYGNLRSLLPGEGRPRPSVLEAAHGRILATSPADQGGDFEGALLLAMMAAVSRADLRDRISLA